MVVVTAETQICRSREQVSVLCSATDGQLYQTFSPKAGVQSWKRGQQCCKLQRLGRIGTSSVFWTCQDHCICLLTATVITYARPSQSTFQRGVERDDVLSPLAEELFTAHSRQRMTTHFSFKSMPLVEGQPFSSGLPHELNWVVWERKQELWRRKVVDIESRRSMGESKNKIHCMHLQSSPRVNKNTYF